MYHANCSDKSQLSNSFRSFVVCCTYRYNSSAVFFFNFVIDPTPPNNEPWEATLQGQSVSAPPGVRQPNLKEVNIFKNLLDLMTSL